MARESSVKTELCNLWSKHYQNQIFFIFITKVELYLNRTFSSELHSPLFYLNCGALWVEKGQWIIQSYVSSALEHTLGRRSRFLQRKDPGDWETAQV